MTDPNDIPTTPSPSVGRITQLTTSNATHFAADENGKLVAYTPAARTGEDIERKRWQSRELELETEIERLKARLAEYEQGNPPMETAMSLAELAVFTRKLVDAVQAYDAPEDPTTSALAWMVVKRLIEQYKRTHDGDATNDHP